MRKHLSWVLTIFILFTLRLDGFALNQPIFVKINGQTQNFVPSPVKVNGRVLVPMKQFFEALGAKVDWNESTKTATASLGNKKIQFTIGSMNAKINGASQKIDVPAQIIKGKTFIPVSIAAQALGATVIWQEKTRTVVVNMYSEEVISLLPWKENFLYPKNVACNPKTGKIYAIVGENKTLAVIDGLKGSILANLDLGYSDGTLFNGIYTSNRIFVDSSADKVYIVPSDWGDTVIVDGHTNKIIKRIKASGVLSAFDAETKALYLLNDYPDINISAMNTSSGKEEWKIRLDESDADNIAFNPSKKFLYISNFFSGTISIVNTSQKKLVRTVTLVDTNLERLVVDSLNNRIYVVCAGGIILCLDGDTGNELGRASLPENFSLEDLVVDQKNGRLYVAASDKIYTVDTKSMTKVGESPSKFFIGDGAILTFNETAQRLYLITPKKPAFQVFSARNGILTKTDAIYLGSTPTAIAYNPNTHRAYIADAASDTVNVVDTDKKQLLRRIPIDGEPVDIKVNEKRNEVYYLSKNGLFYIDGKEDRVVGKTELDGDPQKMAVNELNDRVYVTDYSPGDGCIHFIDTQTRKQLNKIEGVYPEGITVNSRNGKLYVAQLGGGKVSPIIESMETVPGGIMETVTGWAPSGRPLGGEMSILGENDLPEKNPSVALPDYAYGAPVAYDEVQDKVFTAVSFEKEYIVVIDSNSDKIVQQLKVSYELFNRAYAIDPRPIFKDIEVDSKRGKLYVSFQNNGVFIFDSRTLQHRVTVDLANGSKPLGLSLNPADGKLYVANSGNGTISILTFP